MEERLTTAAGAGSRWTAFATRTRVDGCVNRSLAVYRPSAPAVRRAIGKHNVGRKSNLLQVFVCESWSGQQQPGALRCQEDRSTSTVPDVSLQRREDGALGQGCGKLVKDDVWKSR